jgi:hypothetical protein
MRDQRSRWVSKVHPVPLRLAPSARPPIPSDPAAALQQVLDTGVTWGDSSEWLPALPAENVDLFFTSPPYSDARAYSRIHPDRYVDWSRLFNDDPNDAPGSLMDVG